MHTEISGPHSFSLSPDPNGSTTALKDQTTKFRHYLDQSENYYVYNTVHQFIVSIHTCTYLNTKLNTEGDGYILYISGVFSLSQDQPFTNTLPDVFLNSANYLLHKLTDPYPKGISKLYPNQHSM